MFIQLGSSHINLRYVVEIRRRACAPGEDNVSILMQDGSSHSGFMTDGAVAAVGEHIIPAQSGYEAHRAYDIDFDDDELPSSLEWKPVVAFIYNADCSILEPITAEDGRLDRFAVRMPNGRVYTSHETFF